MTESDILLVEFVKQRDVRIADLDLSARAYNALRANGFRYLSDFICFDLKQLKSLDYMSGSIAREIDNLRKDYLSDHRDEIRLAVSEIAKTAVPVPEVCAAGQSDTEPNDLGEKDGSEEMLSDAQYFRSLSQLPDVMSLSIDALRLSMRAYNCLRRAKINTVGELLQLSEEELYNIKNLGRKTADEIARVLALLLEELHSFPDTEMPYGTGISSVSPHPESVESTGKESIILSDERPIEILSLSVRSLNALRRAGILTVQQLMDLTPDNLIKIRNLGKKSFDELECIRREYQPPFELPPKTDYEPEELLPLILDAFTVPFRGLSFQEIKSAVPEIAKDETIKKAVGILLAEHKIEYVDFRCYKVYPSFYDGFEAFLETLKDREREIMKRRYADETLESIAQDFGITRERVRQILAKNYRKLKIFLEHRYGEGILSEDFYEPLFTKYSIPKSFWEEELALSSDAVNYLFLTFNPGTCNPEEALNDEEIHISLRYRLRSFLDRNKIKIDGILFSRNRTEIEAYALKEYAQDEITFERFVELYNTMLEANAVPFDEKLYYTDSVLRTRANRFSDSMCCLWKQGEKLRFYDVQSRDYNELLDALQLSSFNNTEVSTLKFMNQYPELMEKYDIYDAYELHNLLKKIANMYCLDFVSFSRQPILRFGEFNRTEAIKEIIEAFSPLTQEELVDYLYDEFGYDKGTVIGYLSSFAPYYHNGIYSVDFKKIPETRLKLLQENLPEDFYFISDVKTIYTSLFEGADPEEINPYTLKGMGFIVNSTYAIQNFPNAVTYFTHILTKDPVYDVNAYLKRFGAFKIFMQTYTELLKKHVIFRFEKDQIITLRRLEKLGVTEDQICDYCESVQSFVDDETYFTINSLRQDGFSHGLDQLGFETFFYASLLGTDDRFSMQQCFGGTILFNGKVFGQFSKTDFLLSQLREYESIDLDEFIEDINDRFGVRISNRYDVIQAVKDTEMYYDSIMDKVYRDKSVYYSDFDE